MNKQSELIIDKMTDHFALWEEKKPRKKVKSKKIVAQTSTKKPIPQKILKSKADQLRQKEIMLIKEQIIQCSSSFESEIQFIQTASTKSRQDELRYVKEILAFEVNSHTMTYAS